jgi:hypothetical protein
VDQIVVGDVLAVWTTAGNFAKVEVTSVGERLGVRYVTYAGTHPPCWAPAEEPVPAVDGHGDTVVSSSNAMVLCGTFTFDLETGATGGGGMDLWWEQIDGVRAAISSDNGPSRFVNLGSADYDALTAADLAGLSYQDQEIRTEYHDSNVLVPGDVFAVRTGDGNLAKVQVLVFGYDLEIRYVTYSAP